MSWFFYAKILSVITIAALLIVQNINAESKVPQADVPAVISELLLDYDSSVRPGADHGPTHVNLSIHFGYVGFRNNELTVTMFLRQFWTDERLRFKTPSIIRAKSSKLINKIWTPDTFSPDVLSTEILNDGFIQITNEGQVKLSQLIKYRSFCLFNVNTAFHSEGKQNCSISFSSYGSQNDQVDLQWLNQDHCVTGGPEQPDSRATVVDTHCTDEVLEISVGKFSKVEITIEMQTPFNKKVLTAITSEAIAKLSS